MSDYEATRNKGVHWTRVPGDLWERIEAEKRRSIDLAALDGVSQTIVRLLEEALAARKRTTMKAVAPARRRRA